MARGNDAVLAATELKKKAGVEPNAEALIEAWKACYPSDLRAASTKRYNEEATVNLDPDVVNDHFEGEVISYAVRSDGVVVVIQDHDGWVWKDHCKLEDLGRAGEKAVEETEDEEKPKRRTRSKA